MAKVLLIDDEMTMVQMVGELLRSEGHQVIPFTNPIAAARPTEQCCAGPDPRAFGLG